MESSSQETESLVLVRLSVTLLVATTQLNGTREELLHKLGRSHDSGALVGNVVLHARLGVNRELSLLIDGPSEATIVLASIDILRIILRVVNVLLRAVASKSIGGNLELARSETEGHEAKDTKQEADGLGRDGLDSTNVDSLGVIAKPVTKVDAGDGELVELLAVQGAGHGEGEESIFDIAVSP